MVCIYIYIYIYIYILYIILYIYYITNKICGSVFMSKLSKICDWSQKWVGRSTTCCAISFMILSIFKCYRKDSYSQICSNDHLYKRTICLRRPVLSPPKPILKQSLLCKTTTCLTRPATTFFVPQTKKYLSKTATAKLYPAEKWKAIYKK